MLVTFKTKAYANILMMGDVATKMLEMMDFGIKIPGAIDADDIATALANLEQALERIDHVEPVDEADEDQPAVSIFTRAIPLIELLQAAIAEQTHVRWE